MSLVKNQTPAVFNDDPLFDTPAAANYLNASVPTLERHRRFGTGPDWVKMGGLVRYRKSALDRHIDECTRRPRRNRRREKNATGPL
jgi:hypothetical protein